MRRAALQRPHATAALLVAVAMAMGMTVGCRFSPDVASGTRACGSNDACPAGLGCHQGICCAPGDRQGRCKAGTPDKPDAATPKTSSPSSGTDVRTEPDADVDLTVVPPADAAPADLDPPAGDGGPEDAGPTELKVVQVANFPAKLVTLKDDCTHARPATTPGANQGANSDRWCLFIHDKLPELWVVNVTRAAREPVRCDGSDANCRRLSTKHYIDTEDFTSYVNPMFWGDLLIFHEQPTSMPGQEYRGVISAWLPGWPAARPLTSDKGKKCRAANAHPSRWAPAIWCLDNASPTGEADLMVTSTPLVPFTKVARLPHSDQRVAALTNAGEYFAYRAREAGRGVLRVVPTKDAADRTKYVTVNDDVAEWQISVDGSAIYLLRPNGRLSFIDIEKPTVETDLALRITRFEALMGLERQDKGVTAVQDEMAQFGVIKLFLNRSARSEIDLGRAISFTFDVSEDGRYSLFQTAGSAATFNGNVVVMDNNANRRCTIQPKLNSTIGTNSFSPGNRWVAWAEYEPSGTVWDLFVGNPADCSDVHRAARRVTEFDYLGEKGLMFIEADDNVGGTLKYLMWGPGGAFPEGAPTTLQSGVNYFASVDPSLFVLTSATPGKQGVFVMQLPKSLY